MADYQEIPKTIRSFLAATGHPWSADMSEVATAYSTLCREANDRLRRCGEYLRRGLRSEAIQLSECQPKLLPLVEALKLPDPAAWARACVAHRMPAPPELLIESIDRLEAAGEIDVRLQPLLARHRLLSLAKAPVRDRMEVLVPLHEKDPGNPIIRVENLRTLGTVRLKQIRNEAQAAYRIKDVPALEELSGELQGNAWQVDVPDDLLRGVERAAGSLRLEATKEELRPLLAELRAAHSGQDFTRASEVLKQWQAIIDARQLALPAALQDAIRPIVAWVAAEKRRLAQVEKMDRMRPALDRTESVFRSEEFRRKLIAAAVIIAALLIAGALAYFYIPFIRIE